jgi:aminoglycoside phosphotransferase (APT) family kinase protein
MLSGTLDLKALAAHADALGDMLGWIHRESGTRNRTLAKLFDDRSYFESLRLEPYYVYTSTQQPRSKAFYDKLIDATRSRRHTLVHGDFSPKNVLVHEGTLVLLDHEVIHWGDPAFDVGFMLAHLLSKARHLPEHRSDFVIAAHKFWISYFIQIKKAGWRKDLEVWAARHTLACLLARVDGRSPLEYLTPIEREQQREDVLQLMQRFMLAWAVDVSELIDAYAEKLAVK